MVQNINQLVQGVHQAELIELDRVSNRVKQAQNKLASQSPSSLTKPGNLVLLNWLIASCLQSIITYSRAELINKYKIPYRALEDKWEINVRSCQTKSITLILVFLKREKGEQRWIEGHLNVAWWEWREGDEEPVLVAAQTVIRDNCQSAAFSLLSLTPRDRENDRTIYKTRVEDKTGTSW